MINPIQLVDDISLEKIGELDEVGIVKSVYEGIVNVSGLRNAFLDEVILFDGGIKGIVRSLEEFEVIVVMFNDYEQVTSGSFARRTNKVLHVPVSSKMIGRVLDAFCRPIDNGTEIQAEQELPVESVKAPLMTERAPVSRSLLTGTIVIDSSIPIGRGQRELILGEKKTGRTSLAIGAIINQRAEFLSGKPVYCFYVAIGQSQSSVACIVERLKAAGAMEYTTVIFASAADSAHNQFIAPYVGCTIAEFFMNQGHDCLIIYDDLSKHAVANRQIGRLMGMPGGRDAHPANSFYIHSRLLERAACLPKGSLTAIPIVEIKEGELSDFIATNIISITDGQIVCSKARMHNQMPPINVGLSVTRIGTAAQKKIMKQVSAGMKADLSLFEDINRLKAFAGDQLDESQLRILEKGEELMLLLNQDLDEVYNFSEQIILLMACKARLLRDIERNIAKETIRNFLEHIKYSQPELFRTIEKDKLPENATEIITQEIESFKSTR